MQWWNELKEPSEITVFEVLGIIIFVLLMMITLNVNIAFAFTLMFLFFGVVISKIWGVDFLWKKLRI